MNAKQLFLASATLVAISALSAGPAVGANMNTSDVQVDITYSFLEAYITDTGQPATAGIDFELDGPPEHFFDLDFVHSEGDGTGSIDGSASTATAIHLYGDTSPDFSPFDLENDSIDVSLSTYGQSSAPGSNGSAGIDSVIYFYLYNNTYDDTTGDTLGLTLTFEFFYDVYMTLVEDAPAGGQANGFVDVDVDLLTDASGYLFYPGYVEEYYGGPDEVNHPGDGYIDIEIPAGNSYIEVQIRTSANSTTLVVPEPAAMTLLAVGGLILLRLRR